jgi:hypothetical protein
MLIKTQNKPFAIFVVLAMFSLLLFINIIIFSTVISADKPKCYASGITETSEMTCPDNLVSELNPGSSIEDRCFIYETKTVTVFQGETDCNMVDVPVTDREASRVSSKVLAVGDEAEESCEETGSCFSQSYQQYDELKDNPIYKRLNQLITFLSIGVGLAVVGSVIVAGIQWSTSGGNPQVRSQAVNRLWNAGVALLLFVLGWAILNWLIPGGPLN